MKEKRIWKNTQLKGLAMRMGLRQGKSVLVRERSLLKDYTYITREIRCGVVLALYPYHFYCQMEDGTKESFRYNEFLGYEARLIRLQESEMQKKEKASVRALFLVCKIFAKQGFIKMSLHKAYRLTELIYRYRLLL